MGQLKGTKMPLPYLSGCVDSMAYRYTRRLGIKHCENCDSVCRDLLILITSSGVTDNALCPDVPKRKCVPKSITTDSGWLHQITCIFLTFAVILNSAHAQILPRSTFHNLSGHPPTSTRDPFNRTVTTPLPVSTTVAASDTNSSLKQSTQHLLEQVLVMRENSINLGSSQPHPRNAFLLDSYLLKSSSPKSLPRPVTGVSARQLRTDTPFDTTMNTWPVTLPLQANTPIPGALMLTTDGGSSAASTASQSTITKRQIMPTGRPNSFFLDEPDGWLSRLDDIGPVAPDFQPVPYATDGPFTPDGPPMFDGPFPAASTNPTSEVYTPLNYTTTDASSSAASDAIPSPFRPFTATSLQHPITTIPPFASPLPVPAVTRNPNLPANTNDSAVRQQRPFPSVFRSEQPRKPDTSRNRPPGDPGDQRMRGSVLSAPNPYTGAVDGDDRINPPFRRPLPPPSAAAPAVPPSAYPGDRNLNAPPTEEGIKLETCSIGDDSTCNQEAYEVCRKDDGVSTCVCRSGTARKHVRDPCQSVLSYYVYIRMNRFYDRQLTFGPQFADNKSYPYLTLAREVALGIDSLLSETDLNTAFVSSRLNSFAPFSDDLLANSTVLLLKNRVNVDGTQLSRHLQEVMLEGLRKNERRLGKSRLFVSNFLNAVPGVQDIDECLSTDLNDCNASAVCSNTPGSYSCTCKPGYGDRFAGDPVLAGRSCEPCEEAYCNQHGVCLMTSTGKTCQCNGWYIGATCQTDGQVVAVACGSSAVALILIAVTLIFLLRWSRTSGSKRHGLNADQLSTLARSEISANTFTYFKVNPGSGSGSVSRSRSGDDTTAAPDHDRSTVCTTKMDNKLRMAYLVHPNLVTQLPAHHGHCRCDDARAPWHFDGEHAHTSGHQLTDSNPYEVRPPGKLAASALHHETAIGQDKQACGSVNPASGNNFLVNRVKNVNQDADADEKSNSKSAAAKSNVSHAHSHSHAHLMERPSQTGSDGAKSSINVCDAVAAVVNRNDLKSAVEARAQQLDKGHKPSVNLRKAAGNPVVPNKPDMLNGFPAAAHPAKFKAGKPLL
ncbi:uncharacterized protein LOC129584639 isoform X2 [Paramacrobiotus metropolitanus]|uniref:uncharacterized protein LOC129584639 isoform X2 n=1 Tax=Paramacrobiotus metropolitanus TaxID=2943436 RepID=UPI002445A8FA|nr:uncharacterized protein LOC129584639 isoform X2 [Paramacrobiotus metropolitanus]